MNYLFIFCIIQYCFCQKEEPAIHLKIQPAKHLILQEADLNLLKQEIEHDLNKEIDQLEEKFASNERQKQKSGGNWNVQGAPIFMPHQYTNPYLMPIHIKEDDEDDDEDQEDQQRRFKQQKVLKNQNGKLQQRFEQIQPENEQIPTDEFVINTTNMDEYENSLEAKLKQVSLEMKQFDDKSVTKKLSTLNVPINKDKNQDFQVRQQLKKQESKRNDEDALFSY